MAEMKIGFATFNPGSGNGDQAVNVSGEEYKGRVLRTVTAKFSTNDGSVTKNVVVNQQPVTEFVKIDSTASIDKTGGTITINGTSNSTKLTFSLKADKTHPLTVELPKQYTAAGGQVDNGAVIDSDPGATGAFNFSITLSNIPANSTVDSLITTLTVTAAGGQKANTVITQASGDPTLKVDTGTINLDANGTQQTINVTSNTAWSISQVASRMLKSIEK